MILSQIEWPRLITVFITQPISAIIFIGLAIRILIRKRDQISLSLATFYIISSLTIIFNVIFIVISVFYQHELLLYLFYFLTAYPLIFSPFFIIIFLTLLLNIENRFGSWKNIIFLILYSIGCLLILFYPGGIYLDPLNNWRPIFSFEFSLVTYTFFTLVIFIPTLIFSIKLYRKFVAKNLKKKFGMLMIGIFELLTIMYGTVWFNSTTDTLIRSFWSVLTVIILITSLIFLYCGIGQKL